MHGSHGVSCKRFWTIHRQWRFKVHERVSESFWPSH